jgi:glutamate dehydrogenase (NAD(P)+)
MSLDGATLAVQGFGNVGAVGARLLAEEGCKVIAVSDSKGGIHNSGGLDLQAVSRHKKETGSVIDYKDSANITHAELWELQCDILLPAALGEGICAGNAAAVKAKIIVEGANGPTTPEADKILGDRGKFVIPDILANAGGVVVSYFEWVQGLQSFFWSEDEVNANLEKIMVRAFDDVLAISQSKEIDMRIAAYILAIDRVACATLLRGIYP